MTSREDRFISRFMAKVGRNDRCPCESGKKYKQCHAIAEGNAMADSDRAMRLHELDRAIVERLLRFATLERGEEWLFELVDGLEIDPEEIEHHEGRVPARERVDVSSVWSELGLRDAGMRS